MEPDQRITDLARDFVSCKTMEESEKVVTEFFKLEDFEQYGFLAFVAGHIQAIRKFIEIQGKRIEP